MEYKHASTEYIALYYVYHFIYVYSSSCVKKRLSREKGQNHARAHLVCRVESLEHNNQNASKIVEKVYFLRSYNGRNLIERTDSPKIDDYG